jgi:hypothetical protein
METNSSPSKETHATCGTCNKDLTGNQRKWCSEYCKNHHTNRKYQTYVCQQNRGHLRKIELAKNKGGSCEICGYKKNYAALSFHHLDPSVKSFNLDIRSCSNRKWQKLVDEAEKCQLLCMNCHAEVHNPTFVV